MTFTLWFGKLIVVRYKAFPDFSCKQLTSSHGAIFSHNNIDALNTSFVLLFNDYSY